VSPSFATWFVEQTHAFKGIRARVIEVGVSRSDTTGESDLVVVFEEPDSGGRFALQIEDKIDAPLQPEQEARYRLRAQAAIQKGQYSEFEVSFVRRRRTRSLTRRPPDSIRVCTMRISASFSNRKA